MSKKRLVGGEFLINLAVMNFILSVDKTTYTDITNQDVINQLTDLKTYIHNPKSIKPIWVLMQDSDDYIVGKGELTKDKDSNVFGLKINLKGKVLSIKVTFTQVLNEDDEPIDDYYIDTGDAEYNFVEEVESINAVKKIPAPESTTLTDDEIAVITDGVFVEGTWGGFTNPVLFPARYFGNRYYQGVMIGQTGAGSFITCYLIDTNDNSIQLNSPNKYINLNSIYTFNGKEVPNYPANDVTKYFKCVNGTLEYGDVKMEDIVDAQGNKRFIEGNITIEEITGITQTYGKWSLSGTHLMIVVGYNIANGTTLTGQKLCSINVPQWVLDKIVPLYLTTIDVEAPSGYSDDGSTIQSLTHALKKETTGLQMNIASITTTAKRNFRIQFDLLIDNEE